MPMHGAWSLTRHHIRTPCGVRPSATAAQIDLARAVRADVDGADHADAEPGPRVAMRDGHVVLGPRANRGWPHLVVGALDTLPWRRRQMRFVPGRCGCDGVGPLDDVAALVERAPVMPFLPYCDNRLNPPSTNR